MESHRTFIITPSSCFPSSWAVGAMLGAAFLAPWGHPIADLIRQRPEQDRIVTEYRIPHGELHITNSGTTGETGTR